MHDTVYISVSVVPVVGTVAVVPVVDTAVGTVVDTVAVAAGNHHSFVVAAADCTPPCSAAVQSIAVGQYS